MNNEKRQNHSLREALKEGHALNKGRNYLAYYAGYFSLIFGAGSILSRGDIKLGAVQCGAGVLLPTLTLIDNLLNGKQELKKKRGMGR